MMKCIKRPWPKIESMLPYSHIYTGADIGFCGAQEENIGDTWHLWHIVLWPRWYGAKGDSPVIVGALGIFPRKF